jgi:hypothetical protein
MPLPTRGGYEGPGTLNKYLDIGRGPCLVNYQKHKGSGHSVLFVFL